MQDHATSAKYPFYFGSAHAEGLHMALCDGSVRMVEYEVDDPVWVALGARNDESVQ
jgi:hypothetical protein